MKHEHRILEKQLISGKISPQEFKERIDEFVERYNRLIDQESEKHREPFQPHEHI